MPTRGKNAFYVEPILDETGDPIYDENGDEITEELTEYVGQTASQDI